MSEAACDAHGRIRLDECFARNYFPTKKDLLRASLESCRQTSIASALRRLLPMEPSTQAPVHAIRVMEASLIMSWPD